MDFLSIVNKNTTDHVNVDGILEDLGVKLNKSVKMDPVHFGELYQKNGSWQLDLNAAQSELRKRHVVAHVIGHMVMHRDRLGQGLNEGQDYRQDVLSDHHNSEIGEQEETEANVFAAELLLPQGLVMPLVSDDDADLRAAAKQLKCSVAGLIVRMEVFENGPKDLGLEQFLPDSGM